MRSEIKTYKFICDECNKEIIFQSSEELKDAYPPYCGYEYLVDEFFKEATMHKDCCGDCIKNIPPDRRVVY